MGVGLAVEDDLTAGIGVDGTGDDFDHRGLACTVLTHNGMDFALLECHRHIVQGHHTGVSFGDIL